MKLILFFIIIHLLNTCAFVYSKLSTNLYSSSNIKLSNKNSIDTNLSTKKNFKLHKFNNFLHIIRYKNILPTILLSFAGTWIITPSLNLFNYVSFIVTSFITILIMASSMIINDIFDVNVDKINNPSRPLVTGQIKLYEAYLYFISLITLTEFLNLKYLSKKLQNIVHAAICVITLYTPILKKIFFIKNISCASLVAFGIYFAGLASNNSNIILTQNISLLYVATRLIFFGSLYNELLLDMYDSEGDKLNKIYTIPVLFGLKFSLIFASIILLTNLIINYISLSSIFTKNIASFLILICSHMFIDIYTIYKYNYSKNIIYYSVKNTNKPLFLSLIFLCILSCYNK